MPINRSFSGRNRDVHNHGGRLPPGQSLTEGFPVLTAGPHPKSLGAWRLALDLEGRCAAGSRLDLERIPGPAPDRAGGRYPLRYHLVEIPTPAGAV